MHSGDLRSGFLGGTFLYGLKFIFLDEVLKRKRTWKERLFSWPWRPWVKFEYYENPSLPKKGEAYKMGDTFYMRLSDKASIEASIRESETDG